MDGSGEEPLLSINLDNQLDTELTTAIQDTLFRDGNFTMNPYRVGWIGMETILFVLVSFLIISAKRDFIKVFHVFLLLPMASQIALDIYSEMKASIDQFPSTVLNWHYYYGNYNYIHIRFLPNEALRINNDILVHYTSYTLYRELPILSVLTFVFSDFLFWSLLFSSIPLLIYSYRSILKSEHTPYLSFWHPFIRVQPLALLFTSTDILLVFLHSHNGFLIAISALIKLSSLLATLAILILIVISPIILCHRIASRTKSSGFVYIRSARSRLIWISLFLLLNHTLSIPYIVWSTLSTWKDLSLLFSIQDEFGDWIATNAFVLHISVFHCRVIVLLISSILLLPNIRHVFVKFFCCVIIMADAHLILAFLGREKNTETDFDVPSSGANEGST
ncbi:hypothetical protein PRIPAC_77612 [Pristionchus pacificus]|uniref:Uncharacterized protein n=1 Tax=Pristionchus pacificus TaxID=54126 RepID=A0A2A6BYU1_PRIPA|nr:hypothetical protein PRIPAC_77612 [Pristionchus pacificus]|eukprot:PDM71048.1 hypothetical protein PRIPAC_44444 [Pristionchus pacificus]